MISIATITTRGNETRLRFADLSCHTSPMNANSMHARAMNERLTLLLIRNNDHMIIFIDLLRLNSIANSASTAIYEQNDKFANDIELFM